MQSIPIRCALARLLLRQKALHDNLLRRRWRAVDDIDRGVIGCLMEDGRATYAEVGAEVGLSASAVKRRVDRLLAIGVLRGFTALVDPAVLGWGIEAYVQVHCRGTVLPRELRRSAGALPETVSACTVSGAADM